MGVTSDLTPPTCLSPFAAAAIAGSPPMATAWQAMRLGAVLFIVPFMFVYSPALLMIGSWAEIVLRTASAARATWRADAQRRPGFTTSNPRAVAPAASAASVVIRRRTPSSSMAAR